MLSLIFANIGYLYTFFGLIAIFLCFKSASPDGVVWGSTLAVITMGAWSDAWMRPELMGTIHLLSLYCVLFLMNGGLTKRAMYALLLMVAADSFSAMYLLTLPIDEPAAWQPLFLWQSAINVIYLYLCIITIHGFWKGLLKAKRRECSRDVKFMARVKESLHIFR